MSLLGGYQSNINLNNLNFVGDFPIDHSIGGFGTATGIDNYSISLNTQLTNYRQGLLLQVMFQETNTGPVTVNVSSKGARSLKKPTPGGLQDLTPGEISTLKVYILVYDGIHFQLANAGVAPDASETQKGIAMIATNAETVTGLDHTKIITPALLNVRLRYQTGTAIGAIIPRSGLNNVASAPYAMIPGGEHNFASGPYSSAAGLFAESTQFNQWSKAGGAFFNVPGSSQCSVLNLLGTIPPNIGTGALTTNGISSDGPSWVPPENSIQQITIQLSVTQNAGAGGTPGHAWTGVYEGALRRQGGIVTWIGDPPSLRDIRQDAGFAPVAGFTVGGESVTLYIVSLSERILHCSATVYITQTKFSLS